MAGLLGLRNIELSSQTSTMGRNREPGSKANHVKTGDIRHMLTKIPLFLLIAHVPNSSMELKIFVCVLNHKSLIKIVNFKFKYKKRAIYI